MTDPSDDSLDDLLRRSFAGAVTDDGFTARVMHALPPHRQPRPWLLPGTALAGCLLAWLALLPSPLWQQVAREGLAGSFGAASAGVCGLLLVLSLLGCSWALAED
ncbi:MAG: hypothetical protein JNN30_12465 [Rhodanobacteraceae bacterium]|nr:hypothetical protein [Rhodanobacteraceae bacterium]